MAREAQIIMNFTVSKGGISVSASRTDQLDIAGTDMVSETQPTSTSAAEITLGGLSEARLLMLVNLDGTPLFPDGEDSIEIALDSGFTHPVGVMEPGCPMFIPNAETLYARSTANTPTLLVTAVEN